MPGAGTVLNVSEFLKSAVDTAELVDRETAATETEEIEIETETVGRRCRFEK